MAERLFESGEIFAGRYRIISCLGRGGMGDVYRAHDLMLDVPVALKLLRVTSAAHRKRLLNEVRLARQVTHPAVCRVYDVGESQGTSFFTMEYIEGEDLGTHLRRMGRLPAPKVLEIARELCAGLAEAHGHGILHRDLKPTNIMVDVAGRARITDFGVAIRSAEAEQERLLAGTPAYMAPEQLVSGGESTERTDLYALGLVLYELVTGRWVFDAGSLAELLEQHLSRNWESPSRLVPEIDPRLESAILQALSEDPGERPASARALAAALGAPIPETGTPLPAESRQLTVMACDLVAPRPRSPELDPEGWCELVRSFEGLCSEAVKPFEGQVAQHLGNGGLVYFGYPRAHEDDAERAVRAGLAILAALGGLNRRLERGNGVRLAVRIGIHTGPVVMGEIPSKEQQEPLAFGETLDVARRLSEFAEQDSVVASSATLRLVPGLFVTRGLPARALTGEVESMTAHRVLHPSGVRGRLAVATRLTPLVGREPEIESLLDRWEQVQEGMGQAVLLSGEAGIGKSRLLLATRERLTKMPHRWLECQGSPYTKDSALRPIFELIQDELRFRAEDTHDSKLRKLEQGLEQVGFSLPDVVPLVTTFLSLPLPERYAPSNLSPQGRRRKILDTLAEWLLRMGWRQPVVLVVEDLQWVDPSTLELLGRILEQIPTAPVLALFTHRPSFRSPWGLRSHVVTLQLGRLTRSHSARMVRSLAQDQSLPTAWVTQIVSKTDGVPLFVEELTKVALESARGAELVGETVRRRGDVPALHIPATLRDSLRERLDRLGAATELAQLGAVLGHEFSYELLGHIWPEEDTTLRDGLTKLVDAELLYQRGLPPRATYVFKHALVEEEAYQSLLKAKRRSVHRRAAEALEKDFTEIVETQPELVAHHYTEAGLIDPAIVYWGRAGQRAVQRSENLEAIRHLDQALELLQALPKTRDRDQQELSLRMLRGIALVAVQGFAARELEENLECARALCENASPQLFPILWGLAVLHSIRGELEAVEWARQLFELSQKADDPTLRLVGHSVMALVLDFQGEHLRAQYHFERAVDLYHFEQHRTLRLVYGNDPALTGQIYSAWNLMFRGYPDQAWTRAENTLALAEAVSDPLVLTAVLIATASLGLLRREPRRCRELAERALELATEQEFPHWVASGKMLRGWALTVETHSGAEISQMKEGLCLWRTLGVRVYLHWALAIFAEMFMREGMIEEARQYLEEAFSLSETGLGTFYQPEAYRLKGELLLLDESNLSGAESCFRRGLAIAQHRGAKSLELRAATSLARLLRRRGKRHEAQDILASIYGWFTEGFGTQELKDAKALLDSL